MATAQRFLISMCESSGRWTWTAVVLLGFLLGIVSSYPTSNRSNATSLEKRWETLFSRSVLGISVEKSDLNWESDYLLGIKRVRRLYCNVGIGFHLQVLPGGKINGVHNENQYSLIEISAVERGVVSLYGVKSEMFVAMSSRGRLYGTETIQTDLTSENQRAMEAKISSYFLMIQFGYRMMKAIHQQSKGKFIFTINGPIFTYFDF
ncbi:fibroblast growth factor 4B-like isoform X4 [Chanodichthys erythropterus]|uniref:fibroblast growth factor 4B-like isoform X4 n=1 Tax=Chanodichthys erythropterus TaxID=933992 RepID=UPI00351E966F